MVLATVIVGCSCWPFATQPRSEAVDVPIDVRPAIQSFYPLDSVVLKLGAVEVPTTSELITHLGESWSLLTPENDLTPATEYTLELSSDFQLYSSKFTTGSSLAAAVDTPVLDSVTAARVDIEGGSHSCYDSGLAIAIQTAFEPDPAGAYHIISLQVDGQTLDDVYTFWPLTITNHYCGPQAPLLTGGQTVCVTVTAVSMSGMATLPSNQVCTQVVQCTRGPDGANDPVAACAMPPPQPDAGIDPPPESSGCSAGGSRTAAPVLFAALRFVRRRRNRGRA